MKERSLLQPPSSSLAEQSVLGALMADSNRWEELEGRLTENDFYWASHRYIFRALSALVSSGQPLDIVTVSEHMTELGTLEESGGIETLSAYFQDALATSNFGAWVEIVQDKSLRRKIFSECLKIQELAYQPSESKIDVVLAEAEKRIFDVAQKRNTTNSSALAASDFVPRAIDQIHIRANGELVGVQTGLVKFDENTTGFHAGDLIILAARPSMGKTSLALNWLEYTSMSQGIPCAFYSMEMPAEQLAIRLISSFGRIGMQSVRTGKLNPEEWARLNNAASSIQSAPIYIDDSAALSPDQLRSSARRLKREFNIGFVVVDYLQLMQVPGSSDNRNNEIAEISRSLKALAKELELPIVALSQLNRGVEQRENKRPRMSDLRESGGIEQDADLIVFIYRDEKYNPDSLDAGTAEIIVEKQRNGPTFTTKVAFLNQYTRFENIAFDHEDWT